MGVAKRGRSRIVVRDTEYFWGVQGDYDHLVIVSSDKKFYFIRELSYFRGDFEKRWSNLDARPPDPEEKPGGGKSYYESDYVITPSYVRSVIEWCKDNGYENGSGPSR